MSNVVEPNIINPKIISAFDKSTFSPVFVKPNLNTSVSQITEKPKVGLYIGLAVGGLALVGLLVYVVSKNK